ncbi:MULTISPECIES: cupredoxin domain-containing protein [Pseudofrankia]|uniref:cupredoxin domain-containing protein n=1 Tax=Pseudofrankia TaxID=2994363 RepID=UPI000234B7E3|nr:MULTISPECIES: hypothetical protein [Pseudofrankia]OHV37044.1 hypothetical protein BCD49_17705 [Pseudofrankia sp. EUN1h]
MADRLASDRDEDIRAEDLVERRLKELADLAGPAPDLVARVARRSAALRRRRTSVIGAGVVGVVGVVAATVTAVAAGTAIHGPDGRDDVVTIPAVSRPMTGTPVPTAPASPAASATSVPTAPDSTRPPTGGATPSSPPRDTTAPPAPRSSPPAGTTVSPGVPLYSPPPGYYSPPANPAGTITIEGSAVRPATSSFQIDEWVKVLNNNDVACTFTMTRGGSTAISTSPIEPGTSQTMRMPSTAGTYSVVCTPYPSTTDRPDATGTVVVQP